MMHEILTHTKKSYKILKNEKSSILKKLGDVLIEIIIIVFAITLTIWFHDRSEKHHQEEEYHNFITQLNVDLSQDSLNISNQIEILKSSRKTNESLLNKIDYVKPDSLNVAILPIFRKTSNGNYEGFKSSGKMSYISNAKLKQEILKYYQEDMESLTQYESMYNERQMKLLELISENSGLEQKYIRNKIGGQLYISNLMSSQLEEHYKAMLSKIIEIKSQLKE